MAKNVSDKEWEIIAIELGGDTAEHLKTAVADSNIPGEHGKNMRLARALKSVHQAIETGVKEYRQSVVLASEPTEGSSRGVSDDGVSYQWVPPIEPVDIWEVDVGKVKQFAPSSDRPDLYRHDVDVEAVRMFAPPDEHPEYYVQTVDVKLVETFAPQTSFPNLYRWAGQTKGRKGYIRAVVKC